MRIGFAVRSAAWLVCLPLLAACGERVVKEQAAASFVDTSQKALASTNQFYKDLVSANNAYNSFRWAVDPQCPMLSPGERLTAPGIDDPTALPLAIERLPAGRNRALPKACAAYVDESCRHESGGALTCHPLAGAVTARGFFCPSEAAQACAPALSSADWKRVSRYTDNPVIPASQYVSLAESDFSADTTSIHILTQYLDSLAKLASSQSEDVATELGNDAHSLQALGSYLKPAARKPATSTTHGAAKSAKSAGAAGKSSATPDAQASTQVPAANAMAAPLSSLADGIQSTISHGGSVEAIRKVLSDPQRQHQVSDAIDQLARAVDDQFCSTQSVDAQRSASDINNYLGFGYGPNDLSVRETLVNQAVNYKALLEANIHACNKAQQANASDTQGEYHPASPSAVLLIGIRKANDALVKEIVNGELSDADRKKAQQINYQEFESAVEDAINLVTSLKGI
jgi:hypothetical protein